MKIPRLTDETRCQSKQKAIAYAIQQMEAIRQGKEPLSPSMKEKRQAMEMYDKEAKELQQFISKLQPAKEIITQKYNPPRVSHKTNLGTPIKHGCAQQ